MEASPVANAEAVTDGMLASLASLASQSLFQRVSDADHTTQYRMHELVRQYCVEMLEVVPHVADQVRGRHSTYYLSIAEHAHREWDGPLEVVWLDRPRAARPNIDAAFWWGLDRRMLSKRLARPHSWWRRRPARPTCSGPYHDSFRNRPGFVEPDSEEWLAAFSVETTSA